MSNPPPPAPPASSRVTLIVALLGFAAIASILVFFFWTRVAKGYDAARLTSGSAVADAITVEGGMPRTPSRYEFRVGGKNYAGSGSARARQGERLRVAYDPDSPATNQPDADLIFNALMGLAIAVGAPALLVLAYLKAGSDPATAAGEV